MEILEALGLPSDANHNPEIGGWVTKEIVPAALTLCSEPSVMSASGSAIVRMVKEYCDIEYLKTR